MSEHQPTPRELQAQSGLARLAEEHAHTEPSYEALRNLFIAIAKLFIGITEVAKSNSGYFVDLFLRNVHLNPHNAWCAAFLQFCLWMACKILRIKDVLSFDSGSTRQLWDKYALMGCTYTDPLFFREGDMLVWTKGQTRLGHIALIVSITTINGMLYFTTVEGNIADDQPREGGEVGTKRYSLTDLRLRKPHGTKLWCRGAISFAAVYNSAPIKKIEQAEAAK